MAVTGGTEHAGEGRVRMPSVGTLAAIFAATTALLFLDAVLRDRGSLDYRLIDSVRWLEFPGDRDIMEAASRLTGTEGAVLAWAVALGAFLLFRRWLEAVAMVMMPIAGLLSTTMQEVVDRPRPDLSRISGLEGLARAAEDQDLASFPSGHVVGAVLLYGLLFFLAGEVRWTPLRIAVRAALAGIIVIVGVARVWLGSHWVGDVMTSYALGGLMLAAMVVLCRRAEPYMRGVPLVRARPIPHDDGLRHAHALTSTILFRGAEAWKVYNPGFVPQTAYWLAFQAPFPYAHNPAALVAAVYRRNMAGMLTEYWYGERRVAWALRIDEVDGRPAVVGELIDGGEPRDHERARTFLFDIVKRFDAAGLPTWQLDPRQPRAIGNLIERPDGEYMVIDLESGLVSPLASPRAWGRGLRRALVPLFDDVFFDVTREYIEHEAGPMRERMGQDWYAELHHLLDRCEQATIAWHRSETRLWSRLVRFVRNWFGIRTLNRRLRHRSEDAEDRAALWLREAVARWEAEGLVSAPEAEELRASIDSPPFRAVLPHLGVHLVIGVALRFPFGSIARATYTGGNILLAQLLLVTRRSDRAAWKRAMAIHSPLVLLVAAMPGIGTFSYLASKPIRTNGRLGRLAVDSAGEKLPWHVYERLGIRRLVTTGRSHTQAAPGLPADGQERPAPRAG